MNRSTDTAARLLAELGMVVPPALEAIENPNVVGAVDLSFEQIDLLDADLLLLADTGSAHEALTSVAGFELLTAVERDTYLGYDAAIAAGLCTPTPLSIPYVLDVIRPVLERTAAADPIDPTGG